MKKITKIIAILALVGLNFSCKEDETTPKTITDVVVENADFSLLKAAVTRAGLAEALKSGSLTVFAPNNAAFIAAGFANEAAINAAPIATLDAVLKYHVLSTKNLSTALPTAANTEVTTLGGSKAYITKGTGGVSINGAKVIQADLEASNGVIHVIDRVILPPAGDLVAVAAGNPNFSLLVAAVTRVGTAVTSVLTGVNPITVFAPTNAAFAAAGFDTVAKINAAPVATLQAILTYHVVPGRVFSTNLSAGEVTTAQGGKLTVSLSGGVKVTGKGNGTNASNVSTADIMATNGVVHVIDRVLLPQ